MRSVGRIRSIAPERTWEQVATFPAIPEFVDMLADSGAGLYVCQASVDLFGLSRDDFIPQVQDIITVGEFYGLAAGGQIIFT